MYRRPKEIREMLAISQPTFRKLKKIVQQHPERYGLYGVSGQSASAPAMLDALRFCEMIEAGHIDDLPPFDPAAAVEMLNSPAA